MIKRLMPLFLLSAFSLSAQLKNFTYLNERYFADELYVNLAIRYVTLTNPAAPRAFAHTITGFTGDIMLYNTNIEIGKRRYALRNKILGEIIFSFAEQPTDVFRGEETVFSHFLLGQHDWAWNFLLTNKLSLAAGVNFTDLAIGATYIPSDSLGNPRESERFTPEPHGWYLGVGPNFFADFLINDFLLLEAQFDYTFHVLRLVPLSYGTIEEGYPKPQVFFSSINLLTKWGVYIGSDYSLLINNGNTPFNPRKLELHAGFKIMI